MQQSLQNQPKKQSKLAQTELCAAVSRQLPVLHGWVCPDHPAVTSLWAHLEYQSSASITTASKLREAGQFTKRRLIPK